MSKKKQTRKKWSNEEDQELINAKLKNKTTKQIRRILKSKFGEARTTSSVHSRLNILKKTHNTSDIQEILTILTNEESTPKESTLQTQTIITPRDGQLYQMISNYDHNKTVEYLNNRENMIYNILKSQADLLRNHDLTNQYRNLSFKDEQDFLEWVSSLNQKKREALIDIVKKTTSKETTSLDTIDIITIPGINPNNRERTLLMPLYAEDIKQSNENLRSSVYDSVILAFDDQGYTESKIRPLRENFRDLIKINLYQHNKTADLNKIETIINEVTNEDLPENSRIQLVEDKPLYSFCFPELYKDD